MDLRSELVELARERLARLGYRPTLVARDGVEGLAEYGPFDRIIVTCGMPFIPTTWITQLTPGGLLLVDLEGPLSAGNLISLRREDIAQGRDGAAPRLRGRFLPWLGRFMPMRRDPTAELGEPEWSRFGVTATQTDQHMWLDDPTTLCTDGPCGCTVPAARYYPKRQQNPDQRFGSRFIIAGSSDPQSRRCTWCSPVDEGKDRI